MTRVLILGAGGHAQVVADILWQMHQHDETVWPVGYLDDNAALWGQERVELPVLGGLLQVSEVEHDALVAAIGDNTTRSRLFVHWTGHGETFFTARHPQTVIATGAPVGPGSMICAGVVINTGSVIGSNVILNTGCTVDHHNHIGDHVHIAPGVHLGGDVRIGSGTLVGIGATVIPQRSVGAWSAIGAGSVVTKNVADGVMAAGNPARVIRTFREAGGR